MKVVRKAASVCVCVVCFNDLCRVSGRMRKVRMKAADFGMTDILTQGCKGIRSVKAFGDI